MTDRERQLTQRYSSAAIRQYLELFRRYSESANRITETIELGEGTIRRSITLDLTLPTLDETDRAKSKNREIELCIVPLIRAVRGRLFDNLDVTDASGHTLSVLSQAENKILASMLLETEFDRCSAARSLRPSEVEEHFRLRTMITDIPHLSPDEAVKRYRSMFLPGILEILGYNEHDFEGLERLASFLSTNFMTSVEVKVEPHARLLIKYSYDTNYYSRLEAEFAPLSKHPDADIALADNSQLRSTLGQRPYSFRIFTPLAFATPSYHFRVAAPPASYCHKQSFIEYKKVDRDKYSPVEWKSPESVQSRGMGQRGMPYAHLYVHGLHRHEHFTLTASVTFFERPPGSVGVVALVSGATTVVLVLFASFAHAYIGKNSSAVVGVAAIIIALPATAAFWLQPSLDKSEFVTAPLASRLGLLVTGLVAFWGALVIVVSGLLAPLTSAARWIMQGLLVLLAVASATVTMQLVRRLRRGIQMSRIANSTSGI